MNKLQLFVIAIQIADGLRMQTNIVWRINFDQVEHPGQLLSILLNINHAVKN